MNTREKFSYDLPMGTAVDYVEDRFLLVVKDDDWNEDQIQLMKKPFSLHLCFTNGIIAFILEGGALDSADFYFNIQESDEKEKALQKDLFDVEIVFVNEKNEVCFRKRHTLNKAQSEVLHQTLLQQNDWEFMPNEYDINLDGIFSAYEPYDLIRFARFEAKV